MKQCTRVHFENIEIGDRLRLSGGRHKGDGEDFPDVEITVVYAYRTYTFGAVLDGDDGETYYMDDYDKIEYLGSQS